MAELMAMGNDVVHVAVKNDVKESRSTLVWALRNLGAKKVCILHVYQPKTSSHAARKLEELEAYVELSVKVANTKEFGCSVTCVTLGSMQTA